MNNRKKILIFILSLAFIFRLFILINSSFTFFSDDAIYATIAQAWIERQWQYIFHPTWPPLYPALSAFIHLLVPSYEISLQLVSLLCGVLIIIPLFYLVKNTLSVFYAAAFTLAISFFTPFVETSFLPLSDLLFTSLIISALSLIFYTLKSHSKKSLYFGSLFFGLGYLTRSEGLLFFFLTALYLFFFFFCQWVHQKKKFPSLCLMFFLFIIIFFLTISPYVISTRIQLGEWTLSQKFSAQIQQGHMFAINKNGTTWSQEIASVKSPNFQSAYFRNGNKYLLDRFYYFSNQFNSKVILWKQLLLSLFTSWSLLFIVIGAFTIFKKNYFFPIFYFIFLLLIAVPITIFSTVVAETRYLLWVFPILIYFFYLGTYNLWHVVKKIFPQTILTKVTPILITVLLSLFLPSFSLNNIIHPLNFAASFSAKNNKQELQTTGLWIKNQLTKPNPKIMMRHEGVAFYANGETIYLPQTNYDNLISYAQKYQVDYLIAWSEELGADKQLVSLINPLLDHRGLKKLYVIKNIHNDIIIYKLTGSTSLGPN